MTYKLIRNSAFFTLCAMFCFSVQAQLFAPGNDVSAQKSQNNTSVSSQQNNDWGRFYNQSKNSDGQKSENVKEDREPSQKETVSS